MFSVFFTMKIFWCIGHEYEVENTSVGLYAQTYLLIRVQYKNFVIVAGKRMKSAK